VILSILRLRGSVVKPQRPPSLVMIGSYARWTGTQACLDHNDRVGSWVDLGVDALVAPGHIGAEAASALKAEARRRVTTGEYFGHIAYMSLVARKPT
jgi:hypothetical protein